MSDLRDFTGKNRKFTGTDSIKLPTGTQAQRIDTQANLRFNSDTNLAEYYNGTDWKPIDSPPTITNFTIDGGSAVTSAAVDNTAGGDATIVINGSLFDTTSGTVVFEPEGGGSNVVTQSITRTSASQFTVTVTRADFLEANDPYAIKLTNASGLAATLASAIDVNVPPVFATDADTNIGTVQSGQTDFSALTSVASTDADGDTITHTISAGTLPNGMSLSTNGTFTGTASSLPSSVTEYTFTVQAATTFHTVTRQFKVNGVDSLFISATGGTVTTDGDYKVHTFNNSSNFVVSNAGVSPDNVVQYLVVAGGGGGGAGRANDGNHCSGGGGGAGGMRYNNTTDFTVTPQTYAITVGGGGSGGNGYARGSSGSTSTFANITSAGGGGGGSAQEESGIAGGSGGGGGNDFDNPTSGGAGNTPSTSPSQGNNGGNVISNTGNFGSGGGGGAGNAGGSSNGPGGNGGNGTALSITGSSVTYAGGGGAGVYSETGAGSGGSGGGGNSTSGHASGQNGTDNLGGGGGGVSNRSDASITGGSGGKGVVILRYKYQ